MEGPVDGTTLGMIVFWIAALSAAVIAGINAVLGVRQRREFEERFRRMQQGMIDAQPDPKPLEKQPSPVKPTLDTCTIELIAGGEIVCKAAVIEEKAGFLWFFEEEDGREITAVIRSKQVLSVIVGDPVEPKSEAAA